MTKETEAKAKTEAKTEAKAAANSAAAAVRTVAQDASERVSGAAKTVTSLASAATSTGRLAAEGVVAVDKAILGYAGEAVKSYASLWRDIFSAKSLNDVAELSLAYAHGRIDATAANAHELLALAKDKTIEAYVPVKTAFESAKDQAEVKAAA